MVRDVRADDDDWLYHGTTDAQEVAQRYDAWATSYDADLASWSYDAPSTVAEVVVERAPEATSVLDVGCGTGLVGTALRKRGYAGRLRGLDISADSLRLARASGSYDALGPADLQGPLDVGDDEFDALVCVGVMTYLPEVETVWRELTRTVRPGGLVVVTQREDLWEHRACSAVSDRLVTEGVWTTIAVSGPSPYLPGSSGGLAELGCYYLLAEVG